MQVENEGPGVGESEVLNEFLVPFGEWIKQIVFWVDQNLGSTDGAWLDVLGAIRWPFDFFMNLIVSQEPSIQTIPWIWVVMLMFLVASFTRNVRVGVMVALMLTICGLLGPDYWPETAKTIGMIFVSVLLSAIIGVPLGILSGRVDAVWNVVRPTLDAMQVVHSFVYMLPFVFFWGIGEVSATMVTMVFALPPLVRLTNLGIRQVPEDVVEAARAFGSPERRVLTEVQLPLARQAIMTGLNQTLLLAISMLGIAAIMGAGGLGLLVFRAINNSSVSLAASAGLALFLVAVVLDRMTQPEAHDGTNLLDRVREAWVLRKDPEAMMEAVAEREAAAAEADAMDDEGRPAPVGARERLGLMIAAAGGIVAALSTLLTWGNDSGGISGWARRIDQDLTGMSFSGLSASGGSWFGYVVLFVGVLGALWAVYNLVSFPPVINAVLGKVQGVLLAALAALLVLMAVLSIFDVDTDAIGTVALIVFAVLIVVIGMDVYTSGMPRAGADGLLVLGGGATAASLGYALSGANPLNVAYSHGAGVWIAVLGSLMLLGGAMIALMSAPYSPRRPLPISISTGRLVGAVCGLLLVVMGAFSGWTFDSRQDAVITPEIQAQIDELRAEAEADPAIAPINASLIQNLVNGARNNDEIVVDGLTTDGSGLGRVTLLFAAIGLVASIPASGLMGGGERRRWQGSAVLAAAGLGVLAVSLGWVGSIARVADPRLVSGAGVLLTGIGGFIIFASGRSVVEEFRRSRVYGDRAAALADDAVVPEDEAVLVAG